LDKRNTLPRSAGEDGASQRRDSGGRDVPISENTKIYAYFY